MNIYITNHKILHFLIIIIIMTKNQLHKWQGSRVFVSQAMPV